MQPTILIVHGPMASGKSSVCRLLDEKLPDFLFVDREYLKNVMLKKTQRELARAASKAAVYTLCRQFMPSKLNILLQEQRAPSVKKELASEIENFGYRVISIYLHCDVETAIKRDWKRGRKVRVSLVKEMHKLHGHADKEDININTDTNRLEDTAYMITNLVRD